ncbi:hypothetical protein FSB73_05915 [Arachidicoccus ginsenosidivorans]|uniref:Uncharacterized protein n=1 Tax=Arachidicoccus ginsenosidivorans TaxID=496057 RepID=A0A5B8VIB1_9BACT|nr:hypothetical protein FSB73_05915 [Arachidicoccus ginsenosidivorans]
MQHSRQSSSRTHFNQINTIATYGYCHSRSSRGSTGRTSRKTGDTAEDAIKVVTFIRNGNGYDSKRKTNCQSHLQYERATF